MEENKETFVETEENETQEIVEISQAENEIAEEAPSPKKKKFEWTPKRKKALKVLIIILAICILVIPLYFIVDSCEHDAREELYYLKSKEFIADPLNSFHAYYGKPVSAELIGLETEDYVSPYDGKTYKKEILKLYVNTEKGEKIGCKVYFATIEGVPVPNSWTTIE